MLSLRYFDLFLPLQFIKMKFSEWMKNFMAGFDRYNIQQVRISIEPKMLGKEKYGF